jgi:hypothetical protein
MKTATSATAAALDSPDQVIAHRVTITAPVIGNVVLTASKFEVDGDTVSDTAAGTRLDDGYTAYAAEFTVSGIAPGYDDETKSVAWLFARYPFPASDGSVTPLAYQDLLQAPVSIEAGVVTDTGTEWIEQFYGLVEDYAQTSDGEVEFSCIDLRSLLRNVPDLPAVITAPPYNAGLTTEFAIDRLLRASTRGTISSWPAQRPGCLLAVGLRSSMWPEVGTFLGSQTTPMFKAGAFGTAYNDAAVANPAYKLSAPVGASWFIEGWVTGLQGTQGVQFTTGTATSAAFTVGIYADRIQLQAPFGTPVPVATDSGPHYIGILLNIPVGATTVTATVWIDGVSRVLTFTGSARPATAFDTVTFGIVSGGLPTNVTIEALQISNESAPTINYPFTPRAVLDPSKNTLQVIPPISGDPWQTIQQAALAELGVAGFFGTRTFRFYNRDSIVSRPIARAITSAGALEAVGVSSTSASVVNRARVGYTAWTIAATLSTVYTADSVVKVPHGGTTSIVLNLDQYAVQVDTTAATLPDGTTTTTMSWVRVAVDAAGTRRHPGGVTFAFSQPAPDKIIVTAKNTSRLDAYLVSSAEFLDMPPGTPVFRIAGRAVAPNDEVTLDYQWPTPELGGAVSSRFGEVAAEAISGNPWIQTDTAALALAKYIVLENYEPRADLTDIAILPDPRLEPCDVVHLVDPVRTGVDDYARLFGLSISWEQQQDEDGGTTTSYEMTINARALGPPGAWLLGIEGRSELGETTYLR